MSAANEQFGLELNAEKTSKLLYLEIRMQDKITI